MYRDSSTKYYTDRQNSRHIALHRRAAPYSRNAPGYAAAHVLFTAAPPTSQPRRPSMLARELLERPRAQVFTAQHPSQRYHADDDDDDRDFVKPLEVQRLSQEMMRERRAKLLKHLKLERELNRQLEERLAVARENNAMKARMVEAERVESAGKALMDRFRDALDSTGQYNLTPEDQGNFMLNLTSRYSDDTARAPPAVKPQYQYEPQELQPLVMPRPTPQRSDGVVVQPLPVVYDGDVVTVGGGPQFVLPEGLSFDAMPRDKVRDFMLNHLVDDPRGEANNLAMQANELAMQGDRTVQGNLAV